MNHHKSGIAIAAIACLCAMASSAGAGASSSLADLLKQGYEVKATAYIPAQDVPSTATVTNPGGQVLVTLQKGSSIAVCEFNWANYEGLATTGASSFTDSKRCDVP